MTAEVVHPTAIEILQRWTPLLLVGWITCFFIAVAVTVCTCFRFCQHLSHAKREVAQSDYPNSLTYPVRRSLAMRILAMVPVFAWCTYLGMFVVRGFIIIQFMTGLYEALTLMWFFSLILEYCGGPTRAADILMAKVPKQRLLCVPPFCCVTFCLPRLNFSVNLLEICYYLTLQYAVVKPLIFFLELFGTKEGWYHEGNWRTGPFAFLRILDIITMLGCIYALFILYRGTHRLIHKHKVGLKFWAIKGLIIAMVVINGLFTSLGDRGTFGNSDDFPGATRGAIARQVAVMLCLVPVAIIMFYAYPPEELMDGAMAWEHHVGTKDIESSCPPDAAGDFHAGYSDNASFTWPAWKAGTDLGLIEIEPGARPRLASQGVGATDGDWEPIPAAVTWEGNRPEATAGAAAPPPPEEKRGSIFGRKFSMSKKA